MMMILLLLVLLRIIHIRMRRIASSRHKFSLFNFSRKYSIYYDLNFVSGTYFGCDAKSYNPRFHWIRIGAC